jgi:hypothetical protein
MTRRKESHEPDFRISSKRFLKLGKRVIHFNLDLFIINTEEKSGEDS